MRLQRVDEDIAEVRQKGLQQHKDWQNKLLKDIEKKGGPILRGSADDWLDSQLKTNKYNAFVPLPEVLKHFQKQLFAILLYERNFKEFFETLEKTRGDLDKTQQVLGFQLDERRFIFQLDLYLGRKYWKELVSLLEEKRKLEIFHQAMLLDDPLAGKDRKAEKSGNAGKMNIVFLFSA